MKYITKEDTKKFIIESIKNNFYDEDNLNNFMDDLYNTENKEIYPLNENETFVLRKRFGVLDNGKVIKKIDIAKMINVTPPTVDNILKKTLIKTIKYLEFNKNMTNNFKMTSLDNLDNKDDYKNILLISLNLDTRLLNRLSKKNIKTINDLLGYSILDIEEMFGPIVAYELNNVITEMGLCFLDKLPTSSKIDIMSKTDIYIIKNSSIYWLFDFSKTNKSIINYIHAKNIGEYLKILDTLPMENKRKILNNMLPIRYIIMDKENVNKNK